MGSTLPMSWLPMFWTVIFSVTGWSAVVAVAEKSLTNRSGARSTGAGVSVAVAVGWGVGLDVGIGVGVSVAAATVGLGVGIAISTAEAVAVAVAVGVGVSVGVGVGVGVGAPKGPPPGGVTVMVVLTDVLVACASTQIVCSPTTQHTRRVRIGWVRHDLLLCPVAIQNHALISVLGPIAHVHQVPGSVRQRQERRKGVNARCGAGRVIGSGEVDDCALNFLNRQVGLIGKQVADQSC